MPSPSSKRVYTYTHRGWKLPTLGFVLETHDEILEDSPGTPGIRDEAINAWGDQGGLVMSLLGAGHLDQSGLKHALILGCGLDPTDATLP